jgi:predicted small lipoprotein YifL
MRFISIIALSSLLTLGLAGCGQKGPLYLPQNAEAPQTEEQKTEQ